MREGGGMVLRGVGDARRAARMHDCKISFIDCMSVMGDRAELHAVSWDRLVDVPWTSRPGTPAVVGLVDSGRLGGKGGGHTMSWRARAKHGLVMKCILKPNTYI